MEYINNLKSYDDKLFESFKEEFSSFPELCHFFENERLCNEWGRRCTIIIRMLKKIIFEETSSKWAKEAINILVDFISDKKTEKEELQFLSSFENEEFHKYQNNLLFFRNFISGNFFHLISKYKDNNETNIISDISMSIKMVLLSDNYQFLQGLFNLLQYSLDKDANIYIEFILLLNNEDIIQAIIDNKKCILNKDQISFLKKNEIDLETVKLLLEELKEIKDTNDDIINYFQQTKKNKKHKKKKNKAANIIDNSKEEVNNGIINEENDIIKDAKNKNIQSKIEININEQEEYKKDESNTNNINKEKNELNQLIKEIPRKKDDLPDYINVNNKIIERKEEKDEKQNAINEKNNTINTLEKIEQLEKDLNKTNLIVKQLRKDLNEMEEKNKVLMKDNAYLRNEIESLKDEKKSINSKLEETELKLKEANKTILKMEKKNQGIISKMEKEISILKNNVDSCEMKLNMITYREFIKDLINYCLIHFNCLIKGNNLYNNLIKLKNIFSNNNTILKYR